MISPNDSTPIVVNTNGKQSPMQLIQIVLQFMIIPLLYVIWQMSLDVGSMKVQLARLEGRLESHQIQSERDVKYMSDRKVLEEEIERLKATVNAHRAKSTYDKNGK